MQRIGPWFLIALALSWSAGAETLVFVDGTALSVLRYEVKEGLVVLTTESGELRSVPRGYVDLEATRRWNRHSGHRHSEHDASGMDPVEEVIELVALRRTAEQIALSAQAAARNHWQEGRASPVARVVASGLLEGFSPERFVEVSSRSFRENAEGPSLMRVLEWLRSPLARRIRGLEREKDVETPRRHAPSSTRLELVLKLDRATGTSAAAVEMQAAMLRAMLEGMNPTLAEDRRLTREQIGAAVDTARTELARKTRERVRGALVRVYRDVTDKELRRYLAYLDSDDGQWLSRAVFHSLREAMEQAARSSGEAIASGLKELTKTRI